MVYKKCVGWRVRDLEESQQEDASKERTLANAISQAASQKCSGLKNKVVKEIQEDLLSSTTMSKSCIDLIGKKKIEISCVTLE